MRYSSISLSSAILFAEELKANEQNQSEDYVKNFISQNVREASSPGIGAERQLNLDDLEAVSVTVNSRLKVLIAAPGKSADKDK